MSNSELRESIKYLFLLAYIGMLHSIAAYWIGRGLEETHHRLEVIETGNYNIENCEWHEQEID